jgi:DHA3 family tetracycline resistance protein-like MFS transporter
VSRDPVRIYIRSGVAAGFLFSMLSTLSMVFLIVRVELNPFQMLLVGSVLEGSVLLFEIPTGVVADVMSRKLSVVIGMVMQGVGFMLYAVPSFPVILLAQVVWGVGFTFVSGAFVAWLADEIGEEAARPVYVQSSQRRMAGALAGIAASVALGQVALWLPLFLGGVGHVLLGLWLWAVMPETGFVRPDPAERHASRGTLHNARLTVAARPVLLVIFAVAALHGMSTEGFDRLWQLHLIRGIGLPHVGIDRVVWFGLLQAAALVIAIGAMGRLRKRLKGSHHAGQILAMVNLGMMGAVIAFALCGNFVIAVVAFLAVTVLNSMTPALYNTWINEGLDPRSRATVNSFSSQVDALGQVIGGPGLGALATAASVPTAMVAGACVRIPAALLFAGHHRRRRAEELLATPGADQLQA